MAGFAGAIAVWAAGARIPARRCARPSPPRRCRCLARATSRWRGRAPSSRRQGTRRPAADSDGLGDDPTAPMPTGCAPRSSERCLPASDPSSARPPEPSCHEVPEVRLHRLRDADRCRNCGYEFRARRPRRPAPDLCDQGRGPAAAARLDLGTSALRRTTSSSRRRTTGRTPPDLARVLRISIASSARPSAARPAADLPLFGERRRDLPPLVTPSATPRRPLAVAPADARSRRVSPPAAARRGRHAGARRCRCRSAARPARRCHCDSRAVDAAVEAAPILRRVLAALVDVAILGGIDAADALVHARLCGLTLADGACFRRAARRVLPPAERRLPDGCSPRPAGRPSARWRSA